MADRGIRLHEEHGLNMSASQCIICGGKTGMVAFGNMIDEQVPEEGIWDFEPCQECFDEYMVSQKGILLAEQQSDERFPSGRYAILTERAFTFLFEQEPPENRIVRTDKETMDEFSKATTEFLKENILVH